MWPVYKRFVSFTKWFIFEFYIDQLNLFLFMRNNRGPGIKPYGTLHLILWTSDL